MQETWVLSWVGKIPWRRAWQPTPVLLPGESHGQRSLVGYSLWGCRELDTNERQTLTHIHNYLLCSNKCLINIFLIIFKVKFNSKAIICKSVYSFLSFCVASTWRHLFYYQFLPVSVVNMEDINLNKNKNQKSRKIPMNNYNKAYVKVWRIRKSS